MRYVNPAAASQYTFEVDLCFWLALAGKVAFPWLYTYFTGHSCTWYQRKTISTRKEYGIEHFNIFHKIEYNT